MDKLFSDEQLIAFFVSGNIEAWNIFFETYRIHSINLSSEAERMYRGSGLLFDDFYSICLECITVALNKYQLYSCTFYSYWKSICYKRFNAYLKEYSYTRLDSLEINSLSLDDPAYLDGRMKLEEVIGYNDVYIESNINSKELFNYIYSKIELLDEEERQFLFLLIDGYDIDSVEAIMKLKGKKYFKIRNAIKKKLDVELIKQYFN